jgi:hypothetical protein
MNLKNLFIRRCRRFTQRNPKQRCIGFACHLFICVHLRNLRMSP